MAWFRCPLHLTVMLFIRLCRQFRIPSRRGRVKIEVIHPSGLASAHVAVQRAAGTVVVEGPSGSLIGPVLFTSEREARASSP